MNLEYEVLDLGLVYYKNIIPDTDRVIDLAEKLSLKYAQGQTTSTGMTY